jgi:hypothetical protein
MLKHNVRWNSNDSKKKQKLARWSIIPPHQQQTQTITSILTSQLPNQELDT